jgi:hypothetical protein
LISLQAATANPEAPSGIELLTPRPDPPPYHSFFDPCGDIIYLFIKTRLMLRRMEMVGCTFDGGLSAPIDGGLNAESTY